MKTPILSSLLILTLGVSASAQSLPETLPLNTTTRGQGGTETLVGQEQGALITGGLTTGVAVAAGVLLIVAIAASSDDDAAASTTTTGTSP